MSDSPQSLLSVWLHARLSPEEGKWLDEVSQLRPSDKRNRWLMAFSAAPRRLGKLELNLSPEERQLAHRARRGWHPGHWSVDQAARAHLALALSDWEAPQFLEALSQLFDDGDLGELVALYQALPILPHPSVLGPRAAEGVRTNMKAVFEAVALRNPYPADYLDEGAFNQMVLKCLFVDSPLHLVWGIDDRCNLNLARMLCDYAKERWAASRSISPELWRCVGPVADGSMMELLARALREGDEPEKLGVVLSCVGCPSEGEVLKPEHAPLVQQVRNQNLSWAQLIEPLRAG